VNVRGLLESLLKSPLPLEEPDIRNALQPSMMTPDSALNAEQQEWLAVLRR
jgi:hypothetical protein